MFEWGCDVKRATPSFLRALLGMRVAAVKGPTFCPS
jgi:hypothetical protein